MNGIVFRDAAVGVVLGTAVNKLLGAISEVKETTKKFKPVLNHLNDTVKWITPRVKEICRSTDEQEIDRLLNLLNQAKETVDKCSGVSSWNYCKKYKFAKELIELDNSIRTTLQVFFPVMILGDTRKILDAVDELKLMFSTFFCIILEDFHSGEKNTGGIIFDLIESLLETIARSQPGEIVNDVALWKRKKLSGSLLFSSTATWLLQQVYEYNFLTIASWVVIFIVTSLFIWRYVNRYLGQQEATKSRLESIREQVVMETANACWELTDKLIRLLFHVTDVEREWFVFPQTVAFLLIFSYVGSFFDLPTLCRVVMMGTTIPVTVAKHGDRIKPLGSLLGRVYEMIEEKLTDTAKNSLVQDEINKKKLKKQN
ncbi:reticulon-like protein B13 [Durio zibethinus]|uniref:Reticulon-like protein n=1 Tax=Durio zibethinus TaxID=66656 RepID=A0A6P6B9S1_DURZI|nr:reticulon-like protein B13 [Durio zibethinus]